MYMQDSMMFIAETFIIVKGVSANIELSFRN